MAKRISFSLAFALAVALAAQPTEAAWNPRGDAAHTLPSPASGGGKPGAVEMASAFEGLSLAQNEQLYGMNQDVEPADAQVAASPSALVEVAGNTMALFGPDGSLQWTVDIERLFLLPAHYNFYAPSLQYDWGSGRWFLGGIASNTTVHNSWLLMAVSRTGNPFGTWSLIITDARADSPRPCSGFGCTNTVYYMRESIAVVGDKVVQTEQPQNCVSACSNVGATLLVMRKDQLVAGVQPSTTPLFIGYNQTDFLAVQPQSVGGTYGDIAFLVWLKETVSPMNTPTKIVGLLQITGLPSQDYRYPYLGSTTVWEKDFNLSLIGRSYPAQPGGNLGAAPTALTSAIYRDGQVVLAINDQCGPAPPNQVDCVRIIKETDFGNAVPIFTVKDGATGKYADPPTNSALDILAGGFTAGDVFDASLAIDPYGNLFVAMGFSSPTLNPGMALFGISAPISVSSTFTPVSPILEGPSPYHSSTCGGTNAWGAYMRAVPDPNNWSHVWLPGEVAPDSCSWATAIISATMGVGPQATTISPTVGSTKGGQVVEIHGSYFVPNANQVLFGANPGTVLADSSTVIFASAPPGVAGQVTVTVQTPDGTSSAGTFTYITPGQLATPPISTGHYWR